MKTAIGFAVLAILASTPTLDARVAEFGPENPPDGVSLVDWGQIRAEYERHRHSAVPDAAGHKARNPRQGWLVRFDGRGFDVEPDAGGWRWGLELTGRSPSAAAVIVDHNRVSYRWSDALEEWFVNDERGLEHGFTFHQRPADAGDHLRLEAAVRGALLPQVDDDGAAVLFTDASGAPVVRYAGLKSWDARGRTLPARLHITDGGRLLFDVDVREAIYPVTVDPIAQQAYLKASNTGAGDLFGIAVVASANTVVVGAPHEDSNATGVNGDQADNSIVDAGAVYVFERSGGAWSQQAYLKASNPGAGDLFGLSMDMSGNTLVVGAPGESSAATGVGGNQADDNAVRSGAVYVFERVGGIWSQTVYLKASNTGSGDAFGDKLALAGNTLVVGARGEAGNATGINGNQADDSEDEAGAPGSLHAGLLVH